MKMRKSLTAAVMVALIGLILMGCPPALNLPGNDAKTGSFTVKGDLYLPETAAKSGGCEMYIGDALKHKAAWITFCLSPPTPSEMETVPLEATTTAPVPAKGGSGSSEFQFFQLPVVDGHFEGQCNGIAPGDYSVNVYVNDANWYGLFWGETAVTIEGGKITPLSVTLNFFNYYSFRFRVDGLPGEYVYPHTDEFGWSDTWGTLISYDGESQRVYWWANEKGEMIFNCTLPLNYQGGTLFINDVNGVEYCADIPLDICGLDWETFQFGDILAYDYVPSDRFGGFEVTIHFAFDGLGYNTQ